MSADLRTDRSEDGRSRLPKQQVKRYRLTPDHHGSHRRMQQDVILGRPRPDVRWPIPPRRPLSIAGSPQHIRAKVVSDVPAMALRALAGSHQPHIDVGCSHPDTVPDPERGDGRLARQRQLPIQAVQRLAEDGTGLGLARRIEGKAHRQRPERFPLGRGPGVRRRAGLLRSRDLRPALVDGSLSAAGSGSAPWEPHREPPGRTAFRNSGRA